MTDPQLTLAILAGGRARRLGGRDKGALLYQGKTLLDRLLELQRLCGGGVQVVKEDVVPGKGAPGGVVTALLEAKTPRVLVVCCDMPRVTQDAVAALIAVGKPACFAGAGSELHPFPGIYSSEWGASWLALLPGNPSMRGLLSAAAPVAVPLTDPDVVRSVNTQSDAVSLGVDIR